MDPSVVVAIVSVIGSVIVSMITGHYSAQRVVSQLEVKVDLLWKTYIVDAVATSRNSGLIAKHSPESPTEEWNRVVPDKLRRLVQNTIQETSLFMSSPYDIVIETIKAIGLQTLLENIPSLTASEIIGTLYIITERILDANKY